MVTNICALTGYSIVVLLLFATTTALQFSSTVLLSDLRLGQIAGLPTQRNATYDFVYTHGGTGPDPGVYRPSGYSYPIQLRTSTWLRNPPSFPAFAEYSSPVPGLEGVDDTGVLLRSFLPFADAQSREGIRDYSGPAMVLDSRVSCQRPHLSRVSTSEGGSALTGRIAGMFEPSAEVDKLWTPGRIPFKCSVFFSENALSICQVVYLSPFTDSYASSGGLLSEFSNITTKDVSKLVTQGYSLWSLPLLVIQAHNVTENKIGNVLGFGSHGPWTDVHTPWQTWSISICYSAWATADLDVDMNGNDNRTEPIAHWNPQREYYTEPDVHKQLGDLEPLESTSKSRGILHLAPRSSWIPGPTNAISDTIQPFVQQFADVTNQLLSLGANCMDCTAFMSPADPNSRWFYDTYVYNANRDTTKMFLVDYTLSTLFHQTLGNNGTGSLARAMSSLITIMSSMAYYDQMPQFAKSANTTQVFFTSVLYPQSHLGFWAAVIVLGAHLVLVSFITLGFSTRSQYTLLGNHWHCVAQLYGPETVGVISGSGMASDEDVRTELLVSGNEDIRTGVRGLKDRRRVGLTTLRDTGLAFDD